MIQGIYIHIPFCHQICSYCDFNKFYFHNQPVDEYLTRLDQEMELWARKTDLSEVHTIFLGGGTPTSLSLRQLSRLFDSISKHFPVDQVSEFTSEANPDELTYDKMELMAARGVNRFSIGVQTFDQQLLKVLGRTHSTEHVERVITHAEQLNFPSISMDLMYGLPNQTMEQWEQALTKAFSMPITHISAYSLLVEPKTIFYNLLAKGKLKLPTQELEADMYDVLLKQTEKAGFEQYEISNFAKNKLYSEHNSIYWRNEEYLGLGAGAHGYVDGVRYSNHGPLKKYMTPLELNELPVLHQNLVTVKESMEEQMFLGLRMNQGVQYTKFEEKYGKDLRTVYAEKIRPHAANGFLELTDETLRLTRKGRFIGNEIFQDFLLD